jgi:hypothetical protein
MNKRMFFIAIAVLASTVYDFYRGYHQDHSVLGGLVWVFAGLIVLAIFWWLYSHRPAAKND